MNVTETIKESLSMREVAETYGYNVNRAGFIRCPLHNEKTPSLKLYPNNRGFYCFGCGVGGDVINFVKHIFNINFTQAIARLNYDFNLHLTNNKPNQADIQRFIEKQEKWKREEQRKEELFDRECYLTASINQTEIDMTMFPPIRNGWNVTFPAEWIDAAQRRDWLQMELLKNDCEQDRFNNLIHKI